jgi:hypothetical protein
MFVIFRLKPITGSVHTLTNRTHGDVTYQVKDEVWVMSVSGIALTKQRLSFFVE